MTFQNASNNLFREQKVVNSAVSYVVLDNDVIINITDTTAPRNVTLPAPSATNVGKFFVVKDTSGGAASNNITVAGASGNIDGAANHLLSSNYASAVFYSDGSNYFTQSELTESAGTLTIASVTADPAPALVDTMYLVDTSSGAVTITLPTAVGISGKSVIIQKNTNDTDVVIVQTTSSQTINGDAPPLYLTNQGDAVTFTSDNANWQIQNDNREVIGNDSEYIQVYATSNQTVTAGSAVLFDSTLANGGIAYAPGTGRFTLKAGKTYSLEANVANVTNGGAFVGEWYDVTGAALISVRGANYAANNTGVNGSNDAKVIFTPSVDSEVELRNVGTSDIAGGIIGSGVASTAKILQIGGPAAVTRTVEYISVNGAAGTIGSGTDLINNNIVEGNIPYNTGTGVFTLKAGKTYALSAALNAVSFSSGNNGEATIQWVDAISNTALVSGDGAWLAGTNVGTDNTTNSKVTTIWTPTADQTVKLRCTSAVGTFVAQASRSSYNIIQIGSSASTSTAASALSISTVTADPAPAAVDTMYLVDTSSGGVTVTLPTAVGETGKSVVVQKNTNDTNVVTVQTTSSQTINGESPPFYLLNQGDAVTFTSDGSNWQIQNDNRTGIGGNKSYMQVGADSQSTALTAGNPLRYDTILTQSGSDIAYNTGTYEFTLKAGLTYRMQASGGRVFASTNPELTYQWYDKTNSTNLGGAGIVGDADDLSDAGYGGTAAALVTPSTDIDVEVRIIKSSGTTSIDSNSGTNGLHAEIEVISGPAPVTQTVEYISVIKTSDQTVSSNSAVLFEAIDSDGGIPYNTGTGQFTLKAGKTYSLEANAVIDQTGGFTHSWYDVTGSALIGVTGANRSMDAVINNGANFAKAIFTPSVDSIIELRNVSGSSADVQGSSIGSGTQSSSAKIIQIGATAQIAPAAPVRSALGVNFSSATHGSWVNTGFSITVPAGTQRVSYNLWGFLSNDAAGVMIMECRLFDVTGAAVVANSVRYLATAGSLASFSNYGGSASFDARVTPTVSTTYRVEIFKSSQGGTPNTALNMNLVTGSYLEYRNDEY